MKKLFTLLAGVLIGIAPVFAETVTISYYDSHKSSGKKVAKDVTTDIVKNADGSYTIADFLSSGAPLSFTFTPAAAGSSSLLSPVGELEEKYYYYLENGGDTSPVGHLYGINDDSDTPIYWPYLYVEATYNFVTTNKAGSATDYTGCVCLTGWLSEDDNDYADYYYAKFNFNKEPAAGLDDVVVDNSNAPVEYFNMLGVKVDNPTPGLYIRRQGKDVRRVYIR